MSYITRTGNLAAKPTLREGERGPYTYARVIVTDRIRQEDGSYIDGPATAYDVAVSGSQATNLVEAAEKGGNIRITFSGSYRVTEYKGEQGPRWGGRREPARAGRHRRGQRPQRRRQRRRHPVLIDQGRGPTGPRPSLCPPSCQTVRALLTPLEVIP